VEKGKEFLGTVSGRKICVLGHEGERMRHKKHKKRYIGKAGFATNSDSKKDGRSTVSRVKDMNG